jgi:hypothetical protein
LRTLLNFQNQILFKFAYLQVFHYQYCLYVYVVPKLRNYHLIPQFNLMPLINKSCHLWYLQTPLKYILLLRAAVPLKQFVTFVTLVICVTFSGTRLSRANFRQHQVIMCKQPLFNPNPLNYVFPTFVLFAIITVWLSAKGYRVNACFKTVRTKRLLLEFLPYKTSKRFMVIT